MADLIADLRDPRFIGQEGMRSRAVDEILWLRSILTMKREEKPNRDSPLECCILDGVLTITIGVDCLAHAIKFCPQLTHVDEEGDFQEPEITDPDKFAHEVVRALCSESDDGTTLVHIAIDKAAENAIENGAEGIKVPGDDE